MNVRFHFPRFLTVYGLVIQFAHAPIFYENDGALTHVRAAAFGIHTASLFNNDSLSTMPRRTLIRDMNEPFFCGVPEGILSARTDKGNYN